MSSLQKIIQHQVGVKSSLYANELGASNSKINNTNSGKKHNSYQRRLNELKRKKKDNLYARQYITPEPLIGNKTKSYEIVSRGLTPDNFLNCSFNEFISNFGPIQLVYDNFTSFTDYPKTLTLTHNNQKYEFETYKDDLTFYKDSNNIDFKINYGNYNTSGISSDASLTPILTNSPIQSPNTDKILFYVDFNISNNNNINNLSDDGGFYTIFEIGTRFRGTSLIIYKNNNIIDLEFFSGSGNSIDNDNIIYTQTNFDISKRHIFVASFEKVIDYYYNYKIYIDNELVYEKENQYNTTGFIHGSNPAFGFGYISYFNNHINNAPVKKSYYIGGNTGSVVTDSKDNILEITGEVKILKNTYDELVRSNYFSVNQ